MIRPKLNIKQKNFLIDICGKIIVYLFTVALLGKFFQKELRVLTVRVMFLSALILILGALYLAKEGDIA